MKKNAIFGFGAAIMLALFGCANSPIQSETEPLDPISSSAQAEEEAPMEKTVVATTMVKTAPYVCPTATMAYPKDSPTGNMSASGNAATVGLNEDIFTVDAGKGKSSNLPGLNVAGEIRLYSDDPNGDGAYFDVTIIPGYSIKSISIAFKKFGQYATVYKQGTSELEAVEAVENVYEIDGPMFRIKNTQSDGKGKEAIWITSVTITYEGAAKEVAAGLPTQLSLAYTYQKNESDVVHTFDKAATGVTGKSYSSWEANCTSGISYAGNSAGGNNSIQLRASDASGIVSTANPNNLEARKVAVSWNSGTADNRIVDVYGKNEAYSGPADLDSDSLKGTIIGSLKYDTEKGIIQTELLISAPYKYIGIKSHANALYLDSIDIEWNTYTYSDVAIRFGNLMKKTLWDRLNTESNIQGYGVMLSNLGTGSIQGTYDAALSEHSDDIDAAIAAVCEEGNIKNYYTSLASKPNPDLATDKQKGDLTGDYYIWNLYKGVSNANLLKSYDAVAYIRIEDEIVFLNEVTTSVKGLAGELLALPAFNETSFDGSLNNLANLEEE